MPAQQPVTRILTDTVLKVKEGNSYYYRCQATATLNDGKVLIFGIKSKPASYHPEKVVVKTDKGYVDTVEDETVKTLKAKFFNFLSLMNGCFGTYAKDGRNGLKFLSDRMLEDRTPIAKKYLSQYTTHITNCVCLVNGEFVKVLESDSNSFLPSFSYYLMPLDMSNGWQKVENPSSGFLKAVEKSQAYEKSIVVRQNLKSYHKDQVRLGARI